MSKKEKVLFGLILLFFFTLFFPKVAALTIAATVALVIYSLSFSSFKEKMNLFKQRKYLAGMLLFFIWILISVLLSDNMDKALNFLDPRLALFYLPISMGTLQLRKTYRDQVLLGLAFLTTVMCLVCLGYGLQRSQFLQKPEYLYNDSLTEVLGQQSIYISLLVTISIYIYAYFIIFKNIRHKGWLIAATLFLFGMSYLLASRIMMTALYTIAIGFCFYYILQRKKYMEGVVLLTGILIGLLLIFKFFPQTLNRFKELTYTQFNYQSMGKESHYNMQLDSTQWNGANFRLAAWQCGWELFKQNPIIGVHIGNKKDRLFEIYRQKNFQFAIQTNKNVHNNYLDILYSMGIIGLLLFVIGWITLPFLAAWKYKDGLAVLIIFTFAAAWVTEIYFDRNLGGMLTGFTIPFLLSYTKE